MTSFWEVVPVVLSAVLAFLGALYATSRSSSSDRRRLAQEFTALLGTERGRIAADLERVEQKARALDDDREKVRDELRQVKEEYARARIEHIEALADKDNALREAHLKNAELQHALDDALRQLERSRQELSNRGELIAAQGQVLTELRVRLRSYGDNGPLDPPLTPH
jgi:chromosome segregation ATPase